MTRRIGALLLAAAFVAGVAACGDDDGAESGPQTIDPASTTTDPPAGSLPPPDAADLEPIYGEALAELGLRLTPRGGLIDRSNGGYVASPTGRHLALYVEPIDDRTVTEYIEGIRSVAVVFADVFERWPALDTYDVCQEPADPDGDQGPEPLPVTQIELSREEAGAIDWDTVSVVDLVRGSLATPRELTLRVSAELARDPAYEAIAAEAKAAGGGGAAAVPYG
jgi:hypothetical protein